MAWNVLLHRVRLEFLGILAAVFFCLNVPTDVGMDDWWSAVLHTSLALILGVLFLCRSFFDEPWMTELLLHTLAAVVPTVDFLHRAVHNPPGAIYVAGRLLVSMIFAFILEYPVLFIKTRLALTVITTALLLLLVDDCFAEFRAAAKEHRTLEFLGWGFLAQCPILLAAGILYLRLHSVRCLSRMSHLLGLFNSPVTPEDSSMESVTPTRIGNCLADESSLTNHVEVPLQLQQNMDVDYLEEGMASSSASSSSSSSSNITDWQAWQRRQREKDKEHLLSLYVLARQGGRPGSEQLPAQAIIMIACFLRTSLPKSLRSVCLLELPVLSECSSESSSNTVKNYYYSAGSVTARWNQLSSFLKQMHRGFASH